MWLRSHHFPMLSILHFSAAPRNVQPFFRGRTIASGVHCHYGGNDALAEEVAVDCALWPRSVDAPCVSWRHGSHGEFHGVPQISSHSSWALQPTSLGGHHQWDPMGVSEDWSIGSEFLVTFLSRARNAASKKIPLALRKCRIVSRGNIS